MSHNPMGLHGLLGDSFTLLYVDDVRTSQEAHLWASTASYGDSFTLLYVDDVRTSQEAHLWASTASYGHSFTLLYVDDVRTLQEARLWTSTACYIGSFTFSCLFPCGLNVVRKGAASRHQKPHEVRLLIDR
jgi:hypothetical protein